VKRDTAQSENRWLLIRSLFEVAHDFEPELRKIFLDVACTDLDVREEVERLLASDENSAELLLPFELRPRVLVCSNELPVIQGYNIERLLDSGGASNVYLATSQHSGRHVAVKVCRPRAFDDQSLWRFRKECLALSKFSHPGIVQLIDSGQSNGCSYLTMELIKGKSLDAWMKESSQSVVTCIRFVREILCALSHVHESGVIHRDIKPKNIMVTESGHTKIIDFGTIFMTSQDDPDGQDGNLMGTFAYMSPEQTGTCDEPIQTTSDIYQVGLILFEMLTGRLPYQVNNLSMANVLKAILVQHRTRLKDVRPDLSDDLSELVDRAVSIQPSRRPQSARGFSKDLELIEEGLLSEDGKQFHNGQVRN
jgi:serine/threonine protein kinase